MKHCLSNLRLLSRNTLGSAVLANKGNENIFISHPDFNHARAFCLRGQQLNVKQLLRIGPILRREFPKTVISGPAEFIRAADSR
jgi:hypothetical protein